MSPPVDGLLERVRAVVPLIAERAPTAEEARKPDDDVIEALCATGVFKAFVPARYGGYELDLETYADIGIEVAEACPSTGWITTFYMEHNWLLGMFPPETQDALFSTQEYILSPGAVNPSGKAVRRDDHLELTGRWQFGTGIVHADWVLLSGLIDGDDPPFPRMFLVPPSDVTIEDTWHVDGMAATGSHDIVATSVKVPLDHVSLLAMGVQDTADSYLRRIPMRPFLALTAGLPAVGCARRAVRLFQERMTERVLFGTTKRQSETSAAQIRLGSVAARAAMAERAMRAAAAEMNACARGELELPPLEHVRLRTEIALVVRQCRDVVRDVLEASGAKAHFLSNELQRIHRDVHVVAAHTVFDVEGVANEYGRALLEAAAP
ncbi:MAG TPA: acyl-CoA dehydrogenase family protein [Acidimicrobiales bacterium]|nr:acyl-CoA dehydrogenase family protein [Acidimicrobiales bacterium]